MGNGDTDIAANGRVGEVALEAGNGEFVAEMLENSVGQTQIAFCILEVDGVDLVGHCGRAYLTCLDFLLEVLH